MGKERIAYLDTVRLMAMVALLVCHACDPFNAAGTYGTGAEVNDELFFWGRFWGSVARPCVPLFAMLTGALCLPVRLSMEGFYKRRILRVLWPFLIWSVLYNLFPWVTGLLGLHKSVVYDFFVWADSDSQLLGDGLRRIAQIPYRFAPIACHMWYIYMLIGLYLYLPIFSAWVERADARQKRWVLALWLLSTFVPYAHEYVGSYLWGECEWNEFGLFYYFSGFSGYMLLGHYAVHHLRWSLKQTLCYALPAFAVGLAVTYAGFTYVTSLPHATPQQMELYWYYNSPNVVLMTSALFVSARWLPTGRRVAALLQNLTLCGFGIYMIHYFFVGPAYRLVSALPLPAALQIPASALCILAVSWCIVATVKRCWAGSRLLLG